MPVMTEQVRVVYAASGLDLPTPSIEKYLSIQVNYYISELLLKIQVSYCLLYATYTALTNFLCVPNWSQS